MSRERFSPRRQAERESEPFASAEDAWAWFACCHWARRDGARFTAGLSEVARPCDPDDILRAVDRLQRAGRLSRDHVGMLGASLRREEALAVDRKARDLWSEAMSWLDTELRGRGIVA